MSNIEVTHLLHALSQGDPRAMDRLLPIVYGELKGVAHRQLRRERSDHTLNTTALVHEAYLKLVGKPLGVEWKDRSHFFSVAARAMRQILVNYARERGRKKRGGGVKTISLDEAVVMSDERAVELVALDEALNRLEKMSERQARVVECRYFVGLKIEETAQALDLSVATVNRAWSTARPWLELEIRKELASE